MELECSRLNVLITEILDFARLEKSTTDLNFNEVDLSTLLLNIINDANFEFGNEFPASKQELLNHVTYSLMNV